MKDLRIGLVLYGGVSLAVYMNGVVTKIWYALRASVARNRKHLKIDGTGEVYCQLIEELRKTHNGANLRIVIDTIAGTSAGGVNGVVLCKAIATIANAAVLKQDLDRTGGNRRPERIAVPEIAVVAAHFRPCAGTSVQ